MPKSTEHTTAKRSKPASVVRCAETNVKALPLDVARMEAEVNAY